MKPTAFCCARDYARRREAQARFHFWEFRVRSEKQGFVAYFARLVSRRLCRVCFSSGFRDLKIDEWLERNGAA